MEHLLPLINLTQIKTFFSLILLCGNYSRIILINENSTKPFLDPLLKSTSGHHSSIVVINIDIVQHNATFYTDENSLIVSVFDNDVVEKANQSCILYGFKPYAHYLYVTLNESEQNENLLSTLALEYKFDNIGLVSIDTFNVFRIDRNDIVKIVDIFNDDCNIYEQMFYVKTKDFKGEDLYVYVLFDPPRGINLTSQSKDNKQMISMGGRDAYVASLIPSKLNITLKLFTILFSPEYNGSDSIFLRDFIEKSYEEDNFTPKHLEYEQVLLNDYST